MSAALAHRGPDDQGAAGWSPEGGLARAGDCRAIGARAVVGLAHRRLSIIDTGNGGHQPMATEDGQHVLITNGEIYNYRELRTDLERQGVVFGAQSDTEVMLQALRHWGVDAALRRFVGMFAFAYLDIPAGTLTLGRDPFGIKPLVWARRGGDLVFASEPGALLELAGIDRSADPQSTYDYLRFGLTDHGEATMFWSIRHLPPACHATIDLHSPASPEGRTYWRPSTERRVTMSYDEAARELGSLFQASVDLHLRADVPVGAALSGGIDSTAVAAAMRASGGSALALHTFSFVAPGDPMDESRWIDLAGRSVGASIHTTALSAEDMVRDIDDLIRTQGEPFGSTSIYAQNRVYRMVREHGIKVTLDGQGADEVLGGYMPFLAARLASLLRAGHLRQAAGFLCATRDMAGPLGQIARAARFILPLGMQAVARRAVGEDLMPAWMNRRWFERRGVEPRAPQGPRQGRVLASELSESLHSRVLPALLRYQDRNSMAHSVESRVPFLTTDLVDFVFGLPEEFIISDRGETKSVFRAAMRGLVPDAILDRRDKIGFATPQDAWLRGASEWISALVTGQAEAVPAIHAGEAAAGFAAIRTSGGALPKHLWRIANLVRWAGLFAVDFGQDERSERSLHAP